MQMKKRSSFNDGFANFYREKKLRTDFSAKKNAKVLSEYEPVCGAYYSIESQRQEDLLFAEALGKSLDMKIKIQRMSAIDTDCCAYVDGHMYDIYRADPDIPNNELYLYLTGVRSIEE